MRVFNAIATAYHKDFYSPQHVHNCAVGDRFARHYLYSNMVGVVLNIYTQDDRLVGHNERAVAEYERYFNESCRANQSKAAGFLKYYLDKVLVPSHKTLEDAWAKGCKELTAQDNQVEPRAIVVQLKQIQQKMSRDKMAQEKKGVVSQKSAAIVEDGDQSELICLLARNHFDGDLERARSVCYNFFL